MGDDKKNYQDMGNVCNLVGIIQDMIDSISKGEAPKYKLPEHVEIKGIPTGLSVYNSFSRSHFGDVIFECLLHLILLVNHKLFCLIQFVLMHL